MNNRIIEFMKKPYCLLVWALVCGAAYLSLISRFVFSFTSTTARGGILIWVFFPAVICGAALLIIKGVRGMIENDNTRGMLAVFYLHAFVILMGIIFFAAMFV